ncbi:MAG: helix-turn-helix domain-containing protein [Clostridia bacterium]|nr:helix-turn-helix domain-containing protein [Clostridia bacterium]
MNIEIANRLVKMRKAHGFSQEELAARLGISRQAVSKWERAESSPDTDNLIMLSRLYGVSLDSLLATEDEIPMPEKDEAEKSSPAERVSVSLASGINVTDDDGSHVHIGWDGIYVDDSGEAAEPGINAFVKSIEVDESGVTFTENGERVHREWNSVKDGKNRFVYKKMNERTGKWRTTVVDEDGHKVVLDTESEPHEDEYGDVRIASNGGGSFPYAVLVTGLFLLLGFLKGWWHPAWLLFLTIPIFHSIMSVVRGRKLGWADIAVPVLIIGGYAALGLTQGLWHPLWIMLLAIPLYFSISAAASRGRGLGDTLTGVYSLIMVIAYLALGFTFGPKAWTVGWLLFLTIPMFASVVRSVKRHAGIKAVARFPWELLIVAGYLFVGLMFGIWHPTWVAFVLIPVLRWAVGRIARGGSSDSVTVDYSDDDDDDEDDDDED